MFVIHVVPLHVFCFFFLDENRDINIHHIDDDIKRQRIHYSGDQIYPNVSKHN